MRTRILSLVAVGATALLLAPVPQPASAVADEAPAVKPPKGFTALFNGKNLDGWHGMPHFDPRTLAAMKKEDRDSQISKWTADAEKHWSVDKGELVNDGNGA